MIHPKLIEATANWWVEQTCGSKINWDNGASRDAMNSEEKRIGDQMFLMANFLALQTREKFTPEQVEKFRTSLIEELTKAAKEIENGKGSYNKTITCSVDYHPGQYLYEAAQKAEISEFAFPCKSVTWTNENEVYGKCGYGADSKLIMSLKDVDKLETNRSN